MISVLRPATVLSMIVHFFPMCVPPVHLSPVNPCDKHSIGYGHDSDEVVAGPAIGCILNG